MTYVQIENDATIAFAPAQSKARRNLRRERLEHLAELLEQHDGKLNMLWRMEYEPAAGRARLRADHSPLVIASQDVQFRREGLSGDSLGEIMTFFQLSDSEAHHLLCYCHYSESITGRMVASRARSLAQKRTLGQMFMDLRHKLFGGADQSQAAIS
jgi:hypothetical protein